MTSPTLLEKFDTYFARPVAERAASSLKDSAKIALLVGDESFTFARVSGKNAISAGAPSDPDLIFSLTPPAAEAILNDPASEIGPIGVNIAKLVFSADPAVKVRLQIKAGFLTLWSRGYFGVLTAGGAELAAFLASRGLGGLDAIRSALKKMRNEGK